MLILILIAEARVAFCSFTFVCVFGEDCCLKIGISASRLLLASKTTLKCQGNKVLIALVYLCIYRLLGVRLPLIS